MAHHRLARRDIEHHSFNGPLEVEPDAIATVTPERIIINIGEHFGKGAVRVQRVGDYLVIEPSQAKPLADNWRKQ